MNPTNVDLQPHIYTIANEAFKHVNTNSQSVIIMGESGAGKTETTKHIIHFLCNSGEQKLIDALQSSCPILEAIGNCVTPKNSNSSRYCKSIKVFYLILL